MQQREQRIRVLVAEDNRDLCVAVCSLVDAEPDMEVAGAIQQAHALLDAARSGDVAVVILDLNLAGESSVPALHAMRRELPRVGVVVYSGYDRCDLSSVLPDDGSVEYVSKAGEASTLLDAIRRVARAAGSLG